jgi:hypothetical protein
MDKNILFNTSCKNFFVTINLGKKNEKTIQTDSVITYYGDGTYSFIESIHNSLTIITNQNVLIQETIK